jgi:predicted Zn-dependent peptidase
MQGVEGMPVEVVDVDRVPAVWADVPGHSQASLCFRVGMGDERLADRGLTHLCEHLALVGFERPGIQFNGFVDTTRTVFVASGNEKGVWGFLETVAARLGECTEEQLDRERDVLTVEAQPTGAIAAEHHRYRYGSRGLGAASFPEFAVRTAGPDDVRRWAGRYLVR